MSEPLIGFYFLVIVNNNLATGGKLISSVGDGNYLARFDTAQPYSVIMDVEGLKRLTLFATDGERTQFALAWLDEHPLPAANDVGEDRSNAEPTNLVLGESAEDAFDKVAAEVDAPGPVDAGGAGTPSNILSMAGIRKNAELEAEDTDNPAVA